MTSQKATRTRESQKFRDFLDTDHGEGEVEHVDGVKEPADVPEGELGEDGVEGPGVRAGAPLAGKKSRAPRPHKAVSMHEGRTPLAGRTKQCCTHQAGARWRGTLGPVGAR